VTTFYPQSPQFVLKQSTSSIADFAEPRFMTIGGFTKMSNCTFDEAFLISIETHDGRRFVDLDSKRAQVLMERGRNKAPKPG
jgi:hypothetical protein